MQTKAGDPGAFAHFDLSRVDSPAFVVDAAKLRENCRTLAAVRDAAGILDLPGFSRFHLSGQGAVAWLTRQITGKVPSIGRLGLAYFSDDKGRIITEMSVARLGEDEVLLITAATAQSHDKEWLASHLDAGLVLKDLTLDWSTQILTGPKSRAILAEVTKADLTRPWLTWKPWRPMCTGCIRG